jgi:hypothetical protein
MGPPALAGYALRWSLLAKNRLKAVKHFSKNAALKFLRNASVLLKSFVHFVPFYVVAMQAI